MSVVFIVKGSLFSLRKMSAKYTLNNHGLSIVLSIKNDVPRLYILINGPIYQENMTIINIYAMTIESQTR